MAKTQADIRSLARGHTAMAVRVLASIAGQRNAPPSARVAAASELLDRGWGRAAQIHSDPDGGPIQVIIRQIIDITGERRNDPVLIEQDCDK
jgi:hypothetical protein